jgi:hypothetical protein
MAVSFPLGIFNLEKQPNAVVSPPQFGLFSKTDLAALMKMFCYVRAISAKIRLVVDCMYVDIVSKVLK